MSAPLPRLFCLGILLGVPATAVAADPEPAVLSRLAEALRGEETSALRLSWTSGVPHAGHV